MIKVFEKLIDAYHYHEKCPICNTPLHHSTIDIGHWSNDYLYSQNNYVCDKQVPFQVTLIHGNSGSFVLDIVSEKIISMSITQSTKYQPIYFIGSPNPVYYAIVNPPSQTNYDIREGILMQGHRIDCNSCYQYSYTLQLRLDLNNMIVESAILNSEFVSIEEDENVYEIQNIYTMNRTEYSHIENTKRHKTLQLPLVSNDMSNPNEVLSRIKKLLPFS